MLIREYATLLPIAFVKQLKVYKSYANVMNRAFLTIIEQSLPVQYEIHPCLAPKSIDHVLEFEDCSEVYDTAVQNLNAITPYEAQTFVNLSQGYDNDELVKYNNELFQ